MRTIAILTILLLTFVGCLKEEPLQKEKIAEAPKGRWKTILKNDSLKLISIRFSSKDSGYINAFNEVSLKQCILFTSDGGNNWKTIYCNLNARNTFLNTIYHSDIDELYGFYENIGEPIFYKSSNNGVDWVEHKIQDKFNVFNIIFAKKSKLFCYDFRGFQVTEDDGITWTTSIPYFQFDDFYGLSILNEQTYFIITRKYNNNQNDSSNILKSTDGGYSWSRLYNIDSPIQSFQFISEQVGFVVSNYKLYKTTDGGINWKLLHTFKAGFLKDIHFINESTAYYYDSYNIYYSTDGGKNWKLDYTLTGEPVYVSLTSWSFTNTGEAFIIADHNAIIKKAY